jgi:hypothetical protein
MTSGFFRSSRLDTIANIRSRSGRIEGFCHYSGKKKKAMITEIDSPLRHESVPGHFSDDGLDTA